MNMKAFCATIVIAAQAAAFSMAKVPSFSIHSNMKARPIISKSSTSLNLSPASMAGLLLRGGGDAAAATAALRGGAAAADAIVLHNFYGDALGFFGGIRIPATFLAGSSLAAVFTLKNAASSLSSGGESDAKLSTLERRTLKFYHLVSLLAFLLSLNTIVTATSAVTSILHGRFDQMAETAYMLMKREFEYEFVSVRWSFLTSIFCFLGMVTSRVLIEFGLLKEGSGKGSRKDVAMLVVCSVGALVSHLLSYVNQNLWCWRSLVGMTVYLAQLIVKRAFVEMRPLQVVSVLCTMASVFYVGKLAAKDMKE
ncbi:hypothetical protein ACHAXR_003638 [Thalassiosira sp. AJA248-18]